jgi:hypothetical protein
LLYYGPLLSNTTFLKQILAMKPINMEPTYRRIHNHR